MTYYITTFHPLASEPGGPWRGCAPRPKPFVDASCRREPDLEARFPAITGLCRPPSVRRYEPGDVVVYMTVNGFYEALRPAHRRLVAVLRVIAKQQSHVAAEKWYRACNSELPRNIMVIGNGPLPLEQTQGFYLDDRKKKVFPRDRSDHGRILEEWDAIYNERRYKCGHVRICEALYRELCDPPALWPGDVGRVFADGEFPDTEYRPKPIVEAVARKLMDVCGVPASILDVA